MKRIEAVVRRSELRSFYQCAGKLGILGFDLAEKSSTGMQVDFAVGDREVKDTIHAVIEQVHPDSIAIFKFDPESK